MDRKQTITEGVLYFCLTQSGLTSGLPTIERARLRLGNKCLVRLQEVSCTQTHCDGWHIGATGSILHANTIPQTDYNK